MLQANAVCRQYLEDLRRYGVAAGLLVGQSRDTRLRHAHKLADGAVSWDVMKPSEAPAEEVPAEEPAPSSFRLSVRDFRISDAAIRYEDDSTNMRFSTATNTPTGAPNIWVFRASCSSRPLLSSRPMPMER